MEPFPTVQCAECGSDNSRQATLCWLCGARLSGNTVPPPPRPEPVQAILVPENAYPPLRPPAEPAFQFRLSSLFLVITIVCLVLGVLKMAPGLGVLLMIVAVPALLRTASKSQRAATAGVPLPTGAKIGAFFTSLLIMLLVLIAGCIAFCMACFAVLIPAMGGAGPPGAQQQNLVLTPLLLLGSLIVGGFVIWLLVKTWPKAK